MTPEIKQMAEETAIAEWGSGLASLPEQTRFEIIRRTIERDREKRIQAAIRAAQAKDDSRLF